VVERADGEVLIGCVLIQILCLQQVMCRAIMYYPAILIIAQNIVASAITSLAILHG